MTVKADVDRMIRMVAGGMTQAAVARELGVSRGLVSYYLGRHAPRLTWTQTHGQALEERVTLHGKTAYEMRVRGERLTRIAKACDIPAGRGAAQATYRLIEAYCRREGLHMPKLYKPKRAA